MDIGIVEYIVGLTEIEYIVKEDQIMLVLLNGYETDALDIAVSVISKISDFAKEAGSGTVATVGVLNILPGAANIVPGEVKFMVDIRSKDEKCIEEVKSK